MVVPFCFAVVGRSTLSTNSGEPIRQPRQDSLHALVAAFWRLTLVRMRCHQPTKDYVARRTTEGKTKTEIMRCLKRYIAREAFNLLATEAAAVHHIHGQALGYRPATQPCAK